MGKGYGVVKVEVAEARICDKEDKVERWRAGGGLPLLIS